MWPMKFVALLSSTLRWAVVGFGVGACVASAGWLYLWGRSAGRLKAELQQERERRVAMERALVECKRDVQNIVSTCEDRAELAARQLADCVRTLNRWQKRRAKVSGGGVVDASDDVSSIVRELNRVFGSENP